MSITSAEIASQPTVWAQALLEQDRSAFGLAGERVLFLGCGTSAFVAESLAVLRERAGLGETDAAYASEWTPGRRYDRVVAITRSGSTSEVLAALALVDAGTPTAAITAVTHEAVHALVDSTLVLGFADEESVVQTRFPSALLILARQAYGYDVTGVSEAAAAAIAEPLGIEVADFDHFVYLGSGWTYGLAQEAALKVREAAQAWSESYPLLDYRHGPIAVAHPGSLVWIFGAVEPDLIADIEATGATVRSDASDPLVQLVQAQRLAVALAESRGLDPDKPRHLTRSVILP
ncbi:SIS domain-containing protein [Lacisediminihabitans profunda]|uniref:SIS domain-containing protein n=1 Tax=Lacisediminihabitans profunda TaxID=2594790 RepID=A0A5C8ULY2_9MICO|nr:SIS domain-containing protein [Lacisediminihabitans profunda]TXN29352.1 SIS domain-containing protein [Lacisediminihabitans profunda]